VNVRAARETDVPAIVRMACQFIAESGYRGQITPSTEQQERLAAYLMANGCLLVADAGGQVVGLIGLMTVPLPTSGEMSVTECMWWVEPEWRTHSSAAGRLFYAGEQWAMSQARLLGLEWIWMQMIAPYGSTDVETLYKRRGYLPLETVFQKRLRVSNGPLERAA
jgi:hypothetical protein